MFSLCLTSNTSEVLPLAEYNASFHGQLPAEVADEAHFPADTNLQRKIDPLSPGENVQCLTFKKQQKPDLMSSILLDLSKRKPGLRMKCQL